MGSSPDINYPAQPSYGEGMADAMKAQMEQLLGQGEYAQMYADAGFAGGDLGDIITGVEAPIRQKTAQVDTDVLRQTLLGNQSKVVKDPETGKYGIPGGEVSGKATDDGKYMLVQMSDRRPIGKPYSPNDPQPMIPAEYAIINTETGAITEKSGGAAAGVYIDGQSAWEKRPGQYKIDGNGPTEPTVEDVLSNATKSFVEFKAKINTEGEESVLQQYDFTNPNTGEPLKEGEVVREGDGMIDLLGDKRNVQEFTTRQATEEDVAAGLASEVGESITEATGNRQSGFDAEGNFLGLSALAEDIQRGNLSRQREADLTDVERLSGVLL